MQIEIPALTGPLEALAACGTISFDTYPELQGSFPDKELEYSTKVDEGDDPRFLRLLIGRHVRGKLSGHIHFDAVRLHAFSKQPAVNSSLEEISEKCDFINDIVAKVVYNSRFVLQPSEMPKNSTISLLAGIEMSFDGSGASVTAATVRVNDPFRTEVRWKNFRRNETKQFGIEVFRTSELIITEQVLLHTEARILDAFNRFVTGKRSSEKEAQRDM